MKQECQTLNDDSRLEFGTRSKQKYGNCTCRAKTKFTRLYKWFQIANYCSGSIRCEMQHNTDKQQTTRFSL